MKGVLAFAVVLVAIVLVFGIVEVGKLYQYVSAGLLMIALICGYYIIVRAGQRFFKKVEKMNQPINIDEVS